MAKKHETSQLEGKLDKDKILTTEARRIVFDAVMQGYNLKQAAKQAHLAHPYVHNWVSKSEFYALIRQEKAEIERRTAEKLAYTKEGQALKYQAVIARGMEIDNLAAVNTAVKGQNTLLGLETPDTGQTINVVDILALVGITEGD